MSKLKQLWWSLVGAIAGGALGIVATFVVAQFSMVMSPNDPSAGSVAIIIIFFLPVGIFAGLTYVSSACKLQSRRATGIPMPVKRRSIFIIRGILFGLFGSHSFYAGYFGRGTVQLLLTIFFGFILIGPIITIIWTVVDLVTVTHDIDGQKMI